MLGSVLNLRYDLCDYLIYAFELSQLGLQKTILNRVICLNRIERSTVNKESSWRGERVAMFPGTVNKHCGRVYVARVERRYLDWKTSKNVVGRKGARRIAAGRSEDDGDLFRMISYLRTYDGKQEIGRIGVDGQNEVNDDVFWRFWRRSLLCCHR
jgi:hypothetical protein